MKIFLLTIPVVFPQICPIHGKCTHEILFVGYNYPAHNVSYTYWCKQCYELLGESADMQKGVATAENWKIFLSRVDNHQDN